MSPELLGIIFTGIGGLIAAASTFNANRSKRMEVEHRFLKGRVVALEQQVLDLSSYSFELRQILVANGQKPPSLPESLKRPITEEALG